MEAKTIFLNDQDEIIVYESKFHDDNHKNYMQKYYSDLKITEYIPILLGKRNYCVIDLSKSYLIGTIYLPIWMSKFQKKYFKTMQSELERYTLYFSGYSMIDSITMEKLLNIIELMPVREIKKKL